ncbi:MAG: rhomboid family intramembrane serine protease [Pseudobdellovibrionaceae bacterium]
MTSELPKFKPQALVRQTWLSQRPASSALNLTLLSLLILALPGLLAFEQFPQWQLLFRVSGEKVFQSQEWYRLWSALFLHADFKHLLSNSFLFFILGYFLNAYFGSLVFPLIAFVFGGLINLVAISAMPAEVSLIGASGVVFWMGGAWLSLYLFLDRRQSWGQRWLRALGVGLVLFFPAEAFDPQVSYRSHAIGFVFGVLWGAAYFLLNKRRFRQREVIEWEWEENSNEKVGQ